MPSAVEQFSGGGGSITQGNQRTARRRFIVDAPAEYVQGGGAVDNLPAIGSVHPNDAGMVAREYGVERTSDGSLSFVNVNYSTWNASRSTRFAETDLSGNQHVVGVTFQKVITQIPVAYKTVVKIDSESGPVEQEEYIVDKDRSIEAEETFTIIRLRWEIQSFQFSHALAVAAQSNKVHVINGYKLLFTPLGFRDLDNNNFEVEVAWTYDPGTLLVEFDGIADGLWYPGKGMAWWGQAAPSDPNYMREPFHVIQTFPFAGFPIAYQKRIADFSDPDGWQSLPGVPPL